MKQRTRTSWEFWPARLFELPYYLWLLALCAWYRLPPKQLAKANYALDHGEIGIGSKYATQFAFDQSCFPQTVLLAPDESAAARLRRAEALAADTGYPLILKPDMGAVGKGVIKVTDRGALLALLPTLTCAYLAQAYVDLPCEYGVFFVRVAGRNQITGINRKHFPEVVGDGKQTLRQLATEHERFTRHWPLFLRYLDLDSVPAANQRVRLSFIGSHTMGCRFSNDSELLSPSLLAAVSNICDSQPGFNFGRLDVRAASDQAFQAGEVSVIEANGVASLPTHMFDPRHSLLAAYGIFFQHGRWLVKAAAEQRDQPMSLLSAREIWRRVRNSAATLNAAHEQSLTHDGP